MQPFNEVAAFWSEWMHLLSDIGAFYLALKNLNLKILDPHEDIFSNFFLIQ